MKKLSTLEQVVKSIEDYNRSDLNGNRIFEELIKAFGPFIGKPVTKKMADAAQKHLGPDYEVEYSDQYGLLNLTVKDLKTPGQSSYNIENGYRFHLGYQNPRTIYQEGDHTINHSGFRYYSCSFGAAALERVAKNKKILKSKAKLQKMADAIDQLKGAREVLKEKCFESFQLPARYDIERATGIKDFKL